MSNINASASGQFNIGDITVNRLGFGAMRITGAGIWGEPDDREESLRTLRKLPELGINLIDTADSYGPDVSELLIREALHPYPLNLNYLCCNANIQKLIESNSMHCFME